MTRQEAVEKLRQHFIQNEKECESHLTTEEDVLAELNDWFDNDSPSMVAEFVIDIFTKGN